MSHDPFASTAKNRSFFGGAGRDLLLQRLIEQAHYGAPISAVCGPLGAGKSTIAAEFRKSFSEEALCVPVQATLFMNQSQFLEAILQQLPIGASSPDPMDIVEDLCHFAEKLFLDAKTLVLIVDDAHELASEVLDIIETLVTKVSESAVHVLLLGESQLGNMLHNALSAEAADRLLEEPLQAFGSEDALSYLEQKLDDAGYQGLPLLDNATIGILINEAQGVPGALNSQIANALGVSTLKPDAPMAPRGENPPLSFPTPSKQYWFAAAALFVLLIGALFIPGAEEEVQASGENVQVVANESQRINIPVTPMEQANAIDTTDIFLEETDTAIVSAVESTPIQAPSVTESSAAESEEILAEVADSANSVAATIVEDIQSPDSSELTAPVSSEDHQLSVIPSEEQLSSASEFEKTLLTYPSENFTVQIMGSRSEDNVKRFVARELGALNRGYFETRYQNQPWYVVVMGNFVNRDAANRALQDLPSDIRELKPWVRSITDVQSDIREIRETN